LNPPTPAHATNAAVSCDPGTELITTVTTTSAVTIGTCGCVPQDQSTVAGAGQDLDVTAGTVSASAARHVSYHAGRYYTAIATYAGRQNVGIARRYHGRPCQIVERNDLDYAAESRAADPAFGTVATQASRPDLQRSCRNRSVSGRDECSSALGSAGLTTRSAICLCGQRRYAANRDQTTIAGLARTACA